MIANLVIVGFIYVILVWALLTFIASAKRVGAPPDPNAGPGKRRAAGKPRRQQGKSDPCSSLPASYRNRWR